MTTTTIIEAARSPTPPPLAEVPSTAAEVSAATIIYIILQEYTRTRFVVAHLF